MRLEDVSRAKALVDQRRELMTQRDSVAAESAMLGVTLSGRYQDDEMLAAVRPAVVAELQRRITAIEVDLVSLNVEVPIA